MGELWKENGASILTHSDYFFFLHLTPYFISHMLKRCIRFVIRLQRVVNLRVSGINDWKRCVSFWICLLSDVECALLLPIKMCYGFSMSLPFTYHSAVSEWARHEQLVKMTITSWVCFVKKRQTQFKCTHTHPCIFCLSVQNIKNKSIKLIHVGCRHAYFLLPCKLTNMFYSYFSVRPPNINTENRLIRKTAVMTEQMSSSSFLLVLLLSLKVTFTHTYPLIHTASWQLEDLLPDDSMQSTRHLSMIPPVLLCAHLLSNSNQI